MQLLHLPHIHVRYQGQEAAIAIEDGCVLDGTIPPTLAFQNGEHRLFDMRPLLTMRPWSRIATLAVFQWRTAPSFGRETLTLPLKRSTTTLCLPERDSFCG